jgi:ZF-HD class homeobox domain-containing protein
VSLVPYEGGSGGVVKYKECMGNHAAGMGGQAFDGCGEFMLDSPDSIKCAACGCHRSFHRRAVPSAAGSVFLRPPPPSHHVAALQAFLPSAPVPPPHLPLPYHAMPAAPLNVLSGSETPPRPEDFGVVGSGSMGRKRFRTKFTPEQKERMREFAEKQGWRINRNDDGALERFCHEIGVRRPVLKVWMHSHKNHHGQQQKMNHVATNSGVPTSDAGVRGHDAATAAGMISPAMGTGTATGTIPGIGVGDDNDDDSPPHTAVSSPSPSLISV